MAGVVVDVRALQAHDHAVRGIGRYTFELIREIERQDPDAVRAYVADPAFPLHREVLRLLSTGKLRRADEPAFAADPPAVYHVTSPFVEGVTDAPLLPAWVGAGTAVVATAYDLIPARYPEVYLGDPVVRRRYRGRVALLRSCDRLLSISGATTADLVDLAGIPPARAETVHGAAGSGFAPPTQSRPELVDLLRPILPDGVGDDGFVLCPSGAEWRKNLDRLLQAWALVDPATRRRTPLVVQCHLDDEARHHLESRAADLGLGRDVRFTGGTPDAALVKLVQAAAPVAFPPLYEGLGLPVLEARACGAPVVCGDNSSLRELVEDPRARFDAEDVGDIPRVVGAALADDRWRRELADAPTPTRYTWPEVAARVLRSYRELAARPVRRARHDRPRLAIASPVPPQLSGPSTYLANFLEHLPDLCDVTLFTTIDPADAVLPRPVRTERLSTLPLVEQAEGAFDEVLYFIGNSQFHMFEEHMLRRRPGAVFLHDARLTILYAEMARLHPELLPEGFREALHRMYPGRYPWAMGGAGYLPLPEEGLFGVLMVADVARLATRLFVHSEHAADLIELDCGRRPEVLFPIPSPVLDDLGREPGPPTVSSFGFVSPAKRSEVLLAAMELVPEVDLALVGHSGDEFLDALRAEADRMGMGARVRVTGKVGEGEYRSWLRRSTLAVQLRMFSNGESSASVAETLAAGIPTVVTDIGTFSEYPDDVVVKVPVELDTEALAAVLRDLVADPDRLAALSEAGRAYAERNSYPRAAEALVEALFGGTRG